MKAIIYAAGTGRRLEGRFGPIPKLLIPFGGRSLLDWHLQRLREAGCREVVVVTGYLREPLEASLAALGKAQGLQTRALCNAEYMEGSVLSFATSIPELEHQREPLLLM